MIRWKKPKSSKKNENKKRWQKAVTMRRRPLRTRRETPERRRRVARAPETELLGAEDVAGLVGVKESTVWRWCREGTLPCLKVGKQWRVRREALEDFLRKGERSVTLVGQLGSFLRVPDSVLAVAQNRDVLHRLDAAFFRVGEARDGLLVKFYGGEDRAAEEGLAPPGAHRPA